MVEQLTSSMIYNLIELDKSSVEVIVSQAQLLAGDIEMIEEYIPVGLYMINGIPYHYKWISIDLELKKFRMIGIWT